MKKWYLFLLAVCSFLSLNAQDEAIFTHYHVNPVLINPAAAGLSGAQHLQLNVRAAWSGFPDSPKTYGVFYNGPIGKRFGIGAGLVGETAGQLTRIRGVLNYALRFQVNEYFKVSAGFSTELQQLKADNSILGSDFYEEGDAIIIDAINGINTFDASIAAYGTFRENTFFGFNITDLVTNRLDRIAGGSNGGLLGNYVIFAGHKIAVDELNFSLEPSVMILNTRDVDSRFDFNLKAGFMQEQLITGLSYRSHGVMGILLGTKISTLELYYTYDVSFQEFQKYNTGSHEITVAFRIDNGDDYNTIK